MLQVQLATELSAATAQLTTLQLEVSNLNKKEAELQKQIELSTSAGNQNKHEINELKSQNTGRKHNIAFSFILKFQRTFYAGIIYIISNKRALDFKPYEPIYVEYENQVAELTSSLKVERQGRKTAESKITALEDEISETKAANNNLEKVI